ncbi:putative late blight resistance protein homolog R1A-10 [Salvia hispanica]|uniref:putative late blight resistance protein homolog R1A-10 n=1 Tax=Salvia hispanica TaxID=49212 RepID=UPI0020091D4C|nr:putative late blight resistance protein homolog R1A-10 [Salvia hispanica]XP_047947330.1 putative late blight resistance protein homolog R1A-10 [Salvia hispanica]
MAYNLQSLITILQKILDPQQSLWIVDRNKPLLQSLLEKAESLLEKSSSLTNISSLESQIADVTYKAEDIIESRMVSSQLMQNRISMFEQVDSNRVRLTFPTADLQQVIQELDYAKEQVVKLISASFSHGDAQHGTQQLESTNIVMPAGVPLSSSQSDLVGVDADMLQLKDRLTNMQSKLDIIPITGMGGIGKSTLARNLYDDPLTTSHFDYRGWAAISQLPNMRDILLSLLRHPNEKISDELNECNENELKDILYKRLYGRRYMIVLDDIWSTKFWDEIRMYFPNNSNESRIVITTRDSNVAQHIVNSKSLHHNMQLLHTYESWDLLRQIVFGEEDCPLELQRIGTKIVSECGGLPLAIHVIGGLLSKVERSKDVWEQISTDVKASIVESDDRFSNILSLSYNRLPIYLKPCFLYMGAFPEDYEINGSRLMRLWIAEGFVKSNGDKSLEEEADDYLKVLVERNLFLVTRKKYNGNAMRYSIHDLLRDLCIRKANEENFDMRRLHVHSSFEIERVCASPQRMSLARSFICSQNKFPSSDFGILRLVRLLDVVDMVFEEFPKEILQLVNLHYLAFSCTSGIPIGISRLRYLQTLISSKYQYMPNNVPFEVWEISELKHLMLRTLIEIDKTEIVHKTLKTISYVRVTPSLISSGFFKRIPNIMKLEIYCATTPNIEVDLTHLHKLEILSCRSSLNYYNGYLHRLRFPCHLRKLSITCCVLCGRFLTTLCALAKLEVLNLNYCRFKRDGEAEEEWEATEEDEFRSLQFLSFNSLNLVRWKADETNFPRLRELFLYYCYELEEIPSAIGDIPTLKTIRIYKCGASVAASAEQIKKVQQEEYGNYDLKVVI